MFLSCATWQNENVGLISCVHSLRISPGLFSAFLFFLKQLLVAEQTPLGPSDLALFEVVPQELRTLIVVFSSFCRRERDPLIVSVCSLWRILWLTLWGLSRIPWKVGSHTTYCQKGNRVLFEENMMLIRSQIFCSYRDALKAHSVLYSDGETFEMIYTLVDSFVLFCFQLLLYDIS